MNKKDFTLSIATRNRTELLRRVIENLASEGKLPCLVDVVIDSEFDQPTEELCTEFTNVYREDFKWSINPGKGLAAARNHGARICRSKFLRFHDDDDLISPESVRKLAAAHVKQPEMIFLTHTTTDPIFDRPFVNFLTKSPGHVFKYENIPNGALGFDYFWGGRTSLPVEVFNSHEFDEDFVFGAEDIEFGYRITRDGWKISYLKEISAVQVRDFSVDQICIRAFNQGYSQGLIADKYESGELVDWAMFDLMEPGSNDLEGLSTQLFALRRESLRLDAAGNYLESLFGDDALTFAHWVWDKMLMTSKQIGLEAKYRGIEREYMIDRVFNYHLS